MGKENLIFFFTSHFDKKWLYDGKIQKALSQYTLLISFFCLRDIWNGDEQNEREIMHTLTEAHRKIEKKRVLEREIIQREKHSFPFQNQLQWNFLKLKRKEKYTKSRYRFLLPSVSSFQSPSLLLLK